MRRPLVRCGLASYAEQVTEAISSDEQTAAYAAELTSFLHEHDAEDGDEGPREQ